MDPEVQALIAVYQKRLADVTAQAIAYEARIIRLQQQIEELSEPSVPQKKAAKPKKTDAGSF